MLIGGVQELTTLDFPGHLAAVVFAVGRNFRCGYCHNPQFVECQGETLTSIPEEVFFKFWKKKRPAGGRLRQRGRADDSARYR